MFSGPSMVAGKRKAPAENLPRKRPSMEDMAVDFVGYDQVPALEQAFHCFEKFVSAFARQLGVSDSDVALHMQGIRLRVRTEFSGLGTPEVHDQTHSNIHIHKTN